MVFGLLLWVIMFAVVSVFTGFKIYNNFWMKIVTIIIGGAITYWLAGLVKPEVAARALAYGVVWVVVGLILDALITTRFNALIFRSRSLWVGYLVVLLAPWARVMFNRKPSLPPQT